MKGVRLFARLFIYGFLGVEFAIILQWSGQEPIMGPWFANFFMAILWIPLGGLLSVAATLICGQLRVSEIFVVVASFISGAMFFIGIVAATFIESFMFYFLLPPVLYLTPIVTMKLISSKC